MSIESEAKKLTMAVTNLHEYLESLNLPALITQQTQVLEKLSNPAFKLNDGEVQEIREIKETLNQVSEMPQQPEQPDPPTNPPANSPTVQEVWEVLMKLTNTLQDNGIASRQILRDNNATVVQQLPQESYQKVINTATQMMESRNA